MASRFAEVGEETVQKIVEEEIPQKQRERERERERVKEQSLGGRKFNGEQ